MWSRKPAVAVLIAVFVLAPVACHSSTTVGPSEAAAGRSGGSGGSGALTGGHGGPSTTGDAGGVGGVGVGAGGVGGSPGGVNDAGRGGSGGLPRDGGAGGGAGGWDRAVTPCADRPGLRFCDDFESPGAGGLPAAAHWSKQVIGDDTSVVMLDDQSPAHSGKQSLYVKGSGFDTFLVFHDPAVLPTATGKFFLRFFIRLALPMTEGHNTFVVADRFSAAAGANPSPARLGEMQSMLMMTVAGDAHGSLSNDNFYNDHLPGVVFAPGAWTCVELMFDPVHPEVSVSVDGQDVKDLHRTDWPVDTYDALRFGFEKYSGPTSELWFDDVAVATSPIGCN